MFLNLSQLSREHLDALVQKMHLSETDVVAFALQDLFDEKCPAPSGGERLTERARRKALRVE